MVVLLLIRVSRLLEKELESSYVWPSASNLKYLYLSLTRMDITNEKSTTEESIVLLMNYNGIRMSSIS